MTQTIFIIYVKYILGVSINVLNIFIKFLFLIKLLEKLNVVVSLTMSHHIKI